MESGACQGRGVWFFFFFFFFFLLQDGVISSFFFLFFSPEKTCKDEKLPRKFKKTETSRNLGNQRGA